MVERAGIDSFLITLIIIGIAALSNWLQQRAQPSETQVDEKRDKPPPHPPRRTPSRAPIPPKTGTPPSPLASLERELRRVLWEGQPPNPPPKVRPIERPSSPPSPPPVPNAPPQPLAAPLASSFPESTAGFERAMHLHETVARRLRQIDVQTEKHGTPLPYSSAPAVREPRPQRPPLPRSPAAAREAFIASLIFSRPKSLDP